MNDQMKITQDGRVMGDHEHKVEFVRLTRNDDGGPVYVNAAQVRGVSEERDVTWVYVGKMAYMVEESAKAVVTLLEAEMNGGFLK